MVRSHGLAALAASCVVGLGVPALAQAEGRASAAGHPGPDAHAPAAAAPGRTLVLSTELGAPAAEVFRGFTTAEGIKKHWSVAKAKVDFRLGGQIRTCYQPDGDLDAPTAIVNTILAYEPDRMLTIKATAPEGSPAWLQKVCRDGWSVLRLDPTGPDRCRLTVTGVGYPAAGVDPEFDQAYAFFEKGNKWTLDKLAALYPIEGAEVGDPGAKTEPPEAPVMPASSHVIDLDRFVARGVVPVDLKKEVVVNAPPEAVFPLWTTAEGFKKFLGVGGEVELAIGGPIELHFGPSQPEGERGSEGSQYLSYLPNRMVSYSWNAPPKFTAERAKRTWVVVMFTPVEGGKTRVEFSHLGFGPSGEGRWDEVKAYFDRAWTNVLAALEKHFEKPAH